jgi:hypothetical protein
MAPVRRARGGRRVVPRRRLLIAARSKAAAMLAVCAMCVREFSGGGDRRLGIGAGPWASVMGS